MFLLWDAWGMCKKKQKVIFESSLNVCSGAKKKKNIVKEDSGTNI